MIFITNLPKLKKYPLTHFRLGLKLFINPKTIIGMALPVALFASRLFENKIK